MCSVEPEERMLRLRIICHVLTGYWKSYFHLWCTHMMGAFYMAPDGAYLHGDSPLQGTTFIVISSSPECYTGCGDIQ